LSLWKTLIVIAGRQSLSHTSEFRGGASEMAKLHRLISVVLRLAAAGAAAAAAIIMVTSHETTSIFGIEIEAKYSYTPSFV